MYQPVLSRFQSLDPVSPNGVDLLDDNNWFGHRLTQMRNRYGYANNNPTTLIDPSGLLACSGEDEPEKVECTGACFIGKKTTITKCEFTEIKVEEGSHFACSFFTSGLMCGELKKQFNAANKAAEDLKKYPGGVWVLDKCADKCECKAHMLKKGPQKFELKKRTITSTGEVIGFGVITCIMTLTGTVEIDGEGFHLVDCQPSK